MLTNRAAQVAYGSAELQGFKMQDYTCINPLANKGDKSPSLIQMKMELKKSECAPFEFLALYEAKGLGKEFNGILGLSPHKDEARKKEHILWSFKNHGLIGRAMVSFSIS